MIKEIIQGITSYGAALRHISKYRMWGYVLLPGVFSLILASLVLFIAFSLSDDFGALLEQIWPWQFGRDVVVKIGAVFGGLLVLALGAILFKQILMVVLGPFMSYLSAKVERQLTGGGSEELFSLGKLLAEMGRGLRIALRNLIRELLATAVLFILGLFPVFTPFTTFLIFLIQSYYAGFGNMDFALERHFGYNDSIRWVRRHRSLVLGNGIVFMLLFLSLIGFLFAMPLGTVAATLKWVEKR